MERMQTNSIGQKFKPYYSKNKYIEGIKSNNFHSTKFSTYSEEWNGFKNSIHTPTNLKDKFNRKNEENKTLNSQ